MISDRCRPADQLGQSGADAVIDPIEIEWKRKDHTTLRVRVSGREVISEQGELEAYEVIAEDVTRQRELEDHLRRQAASDSLTGLANYRRLVDVLDSEIKRSGRTNREIADENRARAAQKLNCFTYFVTLGNSRIVGYTEVIPKPRSRM